MYLYFLSICLLFFYFISLKKVALKFSITDFPDKIRKKHTDTAYLVGGIYFFPLVFIYFYNYEELIGSLINILFIFFFSLIGLFDDKRKITITQRTFFMIFSAILFFFLILSNKNEYSQKIIFLNDVYNINIYSSVILYSLVLFIFSNINNFSDGVDGLVTNISITFLIILLISLNYSLEIILITLIYYFSFLYLNFRRKFFLGSSGVLLFSVVITIFFKNAYDDNLITLEELFLYYEFITLDFVTVILTRIINKQKPWIGDNRHLHFILMNVIKNKYIINLIYIMFSLTPYLIYKYFAFSFSFIFISNAMIFLIITYFINLKSSSRIFKNIN